MSLTDQQAIPRFQEPNPEPMTVSEKGDASFMLWKQRKLAEGYKYRCPKCGELAKVINMPCEKCGAKVERW